MFPIGISIYKRLVCLFQIPFVKQAEALRPEPLKLFASPWTAPKWMKSNNDLIGLGYLLPEYYQVWADYFVRLFLQSKQIVIGEHIFKILVDIKKL